MPVNWLAADWGLLPPHMVDPVRRYIEQGLHPGGFTEAVICNDLAGAFSRADSVNQDRLRNIVAFFWLYAPAECWGSKDKMVNWINKGGLHGLDGGVDEKV